METLCLTCPCTEADKGIGALGRAGLTEAVFEGAELDGLVDVFLGDGTAAGQVGDSSGNFEDAVVGTGGKPQLFDGLSQDAGGCRSGTAVGLERFAGDVRIRPETGAGVASVLEFPDGCYTGPDTGRWFSGWGRDEGGRLDCRDFHDHIETVQQRP